MLEWLDLLPLLVQDMPPDRWAVKGTFLCHYFVESEVLMLLSCQPWPIRRWHL
jgi:hypothetical protein